MSRKKRNRTSTRATNKKQQTRNFYIGLGVFVLVLVAIGVYFYVNQPPEVSASRLEMDTSIGAEDAEVTIYEYASYGCPSCRARHQQGLTHDIEELTKEAEFDGIVRFVYINYPVISPNDPLSAEAAQCAFDQGDEAFWTFHNEIYDMSNSEYATLQDIGDFVKFADEIGLNADDLEKCLESDTHERTVQYHESRGDDLVGRFNRGIPAYFVNGQYVTANIGSIEQQVRAELN